jgi:hypothetical protein
MLRALKNRVPTKVREADEGRLFGTRVLFDEIDESHSEVLCGYTIQIEKHCSIAILGGRMRRIDPCSTSQRERRGVGFFEPFSIWRDEVASHALVVLSKSRNRRLNHTDAKREDHHRAGQGFDLHRCA